MKVWKFILSFLLVLLVFVGAFIGSRYLFNLGTYDFDAKKLAVFENDASHYYLQGTAKDIIFRVRTQNGERPNFTLVDDEEKAVNTRAKKAFMTKVSYDILPPAGGYVEGRVYTLTLPEGVSFASEDLHGARKLSFRIEKPEGSSYKFTDKVVQTNTTIKKVTNDQLDVQGLNVKAGDVLFGQDESRNYVAYKIKEVKNGTAIVEMPALDEIYAELVDFGEETWDVNEISTNPEIKTEIVKNVRESDFFKALVITAYAEEAEEDASVDVKIEPSLKNKLGLKIEITITLKPGENGLFGIYELQNQQVSITLSSDVALSLRRNIQSTSDWDISTSLTTDFAWKVDLSFYQKDWDDEDLEELLSKNEKITNLVDYQKNVKRITEKLTDLTAEKVKGEIKLFDWKTYLPTVPGLYYSTEVKLFAKLDVAANITLGQNNYTIYTVGCCYAKNEFGVYFNYYNDETDVTLSLRGKANLKAGIKLVLKATFIHEEIANINIDPQVGLYADAYVTFPVSEWSEIDDSNFAYSYFEPGVYFGANVNAKLNLLLKTVTYSRELVEKKFPNDAFTFGNKEIAMGLNSNMSTVRAVNEVVAIPDMLFKYLDVCTGTVKTQKISADKIKFVTSNGTKLTAENGKITLPDISTSNSVYITATYLHTDDRTYSTTFRVLISGSVVEGKVSAYNSSGNMQTLVGAKVDLYEDVSQTSLVGTVKTDQSGKFSFHVAKGTYTLVISANGYKTLVTTQVVGDNEIKYTEHILLMNNSQSGVGSAGGRVTNALDGNGLSGVTIRVRKNWNNTSGAYVDFITSTDYSGRYTISGLPVGYYTVEASVAGYVTGYTNILVLSNGQRYDFDFTITPILNADEIRIVLTWGYSPSDLDSHLIGRTPSGGVFNVYYADKVYEYAGSEMANLDVDDTSSYGPETITIFGNIHGSYTYAVHNYSNRSSTNSQTLSLSGAVVRVFAGSRQLAEFHVPTDQVGTYWTVFTISGDGRLIPINTISNTKPEA